MKELEKTKCSKCGFLNIKGTRTCSKCHTNIDVNKKSCPKCGKINAKNVKKCVNCKFDFTIKRRSIWFNLGFSILLVIVLLLLVYFNQESIVEKFSLGLKVVACFMGFALLIGTFTYGAKDKINYSAEGEMIEENKVFNAMKKFSSMFIIVGGILVLLFLFYYYFVR